MSRSIASFLAAGVGAVVVTSVVATPADTTVSVHQAVAPPIVGHQVERSHQLIDLLAAVQRLAPRANPSAAAVGTTTKSVAPNAVAPAAAAPSALAPFPPLIALADAIDNTYNFVEPALRWVVETPRDLLESIPIVGWLAWQPVVLYNFAESMVQSVIFNFTDWLRGEGTFFENLSDVGNDLFYAVEWVVIDEIVATTGPIPVPIVIDRPPMGQGEVTTLAPPAVNLAAVHAGKVASIAPQAPTGTSAVADVPESVQRTLSPDITGSHADAGDTTKDGDSAAPDPGAAQGPDADNDGASKQKSSPKKTPTQHHRRGAASDQASASNHRKAPADRGDDASDNSEN